MERRKIDCLGHSEVRNVLVWKIIRKSSGQIGKLENEKGIFVNTWNNDYIKDRYPTLENIKIYS